MIDRTARMGLLALTITLCAAVAGCDSHAAAAPVATPVTYPVDVSTRPNPAVRPPFDETPITPMETVGALPD